MALDLQQSQGQEFGPAGANNAPGLVPVPAAVVHAPPWLLGDDGAWHGSPLGFSVLDYGADPTGSTSSTAAFNAAVSTAASAGGATAPGGVVIIPPGQYLLSTTVRILASNIELGGAGSSSLILNGTTNAAAIQFGDGVTTFNRCGIRDVAFAQASGVTPTTGNVGLYAVKQTNFFASNIQAFNFPAALEGAILANTVSQSFFYGIGVQACLNVGITIEACTDMYMNSCRSDANGSNGWLIQDTAGMYCTDCSGFNNSGSAWTISANTGHNTNFFFYNCIGDTSGSYNWQITDLTESAFTNIWGSTQQSRTVNTFANGIILSGSAVHDIIFIGGSALFNNSHGVSVSNTVGSMPTNIQFIGFNFGDSTHGNGQAAGGGYGLEVDNVASVVTVVGGQSLGNVTGPVLLSGTTPTVNISQLIGWSNVPGDAWNFDGSNSSVTITTGNHATLAVGSGLLVITDLTTGSTGVYVVGGGGAVLIQASNGVWVASTTTPAAGKQSIAYNGSTGYAIYNGTGGTVTYDCMMLKSRNSN